MDHVLQKGMKGGIFSSSLGSTTLHALTCRHKPPRSDRAHRLQVRQSSVPWRLSKAPGDDESDDLTLQVDQVKAPGTSAGQRPEPLAGPGKSQPKGLGSRIKQFFLGDKMDAEKLKALGLGAVSSYGAISNITYGGGLAFAWIAFVRQFNKSPLMPGQWKAFVAFYAGFWTLQNFVRPLRFSLAIALAPVFERFLNTISRATGLRKPRAFGVYLFILGTLTSTLVFGSIFVFCGPLAYAR